MKINHCSHLYFNPPDSIKGNMFLPWCFKIKKNSSKHYKHKWKMKWNTNTKMCSAYCSQLQNKSKFTFINWLSFEKDGTENKMKIKTQRPTCMVKMTHVGYRASLFILSLALFGAHQHCQLLSIKHTDTPLQPVRRKGAFPQRLFFSSFEK